MLSIAKAVCVFPTERHQRTGTSLFGECNVMRLASTGSR